MAEINRQTQRSLGGGEITPRLYGRLDLNKHTTGLKTCRNFQISPQGGAKNRGGFRFVNYSKDQNRKVRVIPFVFSESVSYVLEFGHQYIRIHTNGSTLLEASGATITGITQADPAVVTTSAAHGFTTDRSVYIDNVVGMTELNGRFFDITVLTSTTFSLQEFGANLDTTGYTAYSSAGDVTQTIQVATTYDETDLFELNFAQSADVLTITHPDYQVSELKRVSATSWTLTTPTFEPGISVPTTVSATAVNVPAGSISRPSSLSGSGGASGTTASYAVVAFNTTNVSTTRTATAKIDDTLSWSSVGAATGYAIYRDYGGGNYGIIWQGTGTSLDLTTVTQTDTRALHIAKSSSTLDTYSYIVTAVSGSGEESLASTEDSASNDLSAADASISITWAAVTGASRYYVYKEQNGLFGYIGQTPDLSFSDDNIVPDLTRSPPEDIIDIESSNNYPGVVSYFEQRRVFAQTNNNPQSFFMTRPGTESNLTNAIPSGDSDAISATIASQKLQKIVGMAAVSDLLMFTTSGVWKVTSQNTEALTPASIWLRAQDGKGAAPLRPLVTSASVLYVQNSGSHIRDIQYSEDGVSYRSRDMSLLAPHLVESYTIVDWDYASALDDTVWAVRSDGTLLGFTYIPDQEVYAWHRHDTHDTDLFESVCVVPENNVDIPYVVVKRTIDGNSRRYIERLDPRNFTSVEDAFFVDSGLTYDGADVTTISGLWHLEGEEVAILADGNVIPRQIVTDGAITLPSAYGTVHVGLPIQADLETLPLATEIAAASGAGMEKNVERVHIRVNESRGIFVGPDLDNLIEYIQRDDEAWGDPTALTTAEIEVPVNPDWVRDGYVAMRQDDPLPLEVLSFTPDVAVEG